MKGEDLVEKARELVRQGNIRRIIIENERGERLLEVPLTIGVIGTVLLPVWVVVGAVAAIATNCTIRVEKRESGGDGD